MELLEAQAKWHGILSSRLRANPSLIPPPKLFKPKVGLPKLQTYGNYCPGEMYWKAWPTNNETVGRSRIDGHKLREMAVVAGYGDKQTLSKVFSDLTEGARIGCIGEFRKPSVSTNATMAYESGEQVSDAIAEWVKEGYARGPVEKKDLPKDAKVSGIMTKAKPNGSVRVILNLSAPVGRSVNEGIDNSQFPATMSSTTKWLRILNLAGKDCYISKTDWSMAYKQIAVHKDDVNLQWFQWMGKYFCELSLIFGAVSSVGIYDRLAKIVLHIVLHRSKFPPSLVSQHLDDVCTAAPSGNMDIFAFDNEYKAVAKELNILLAPRTDPEKPFAPCKERCVYGINYNTTHQTWWLSEEKIARIQGQLREVIGAIEIEQQKIWSIVGKIIHIKDLVTAGKFHLYHLLKANSIYTEKQQANHMIPVSPDLKKELWWWDTMVALSAHRTRYPNPDECLPVWSLVGFTDAAGGSTVATGNGCGAVLEDWWCYIPWSQKINGEGETQSGRRIGRKLSALELVGPLVLVSGAADRVRGKPVKIMVDNAGSVAIWRKGYSTSCELSSTLVRALHEVSVALECRVDLLKVARCSDVGSEMADALSKAEFIKFEEISKKHSHVLNRGMATAPKAILEWVANPAFDWMLGTKILREIGEHTSLMGLN